MFRNRPYFTVFGGSYVPERHAPVYGFEAGRKAQTGALWLVLCALVAGIGVFAAEIAGNVLS